MLSNSGVICELYDGVRFHVERAGAPRSINSDETARVEVEEATATNLPEIDRAERGLASIVDF